MSYEGGFYESKQNLRAVLYALEKGHFPKIAEPYLSSVEREVSWGVSMIATRRRTSYQPSEPEISPADIERLVNVSWQDHLCGQPVIIVVNASECTRLLECCTKVQPEHFVKVTGLLSDP